MIEVSKRRLTISWLENKLINNENGIIIDDINSDSFEFIQSFLENEDCPLKTKAIYYQAFPGESATEFLNTLANELTSKLGNPRFNSAQSLSKIVSVTGLKMVIIDRSYLHPMDTLNDLLNQLDACGVSLILVGCYCKMKIAQVLSHPTVKQWDKFIVGDNLEACPKYDDVLGLELLD